MNIQAFIQAVNESNCALTTGFKTEKSKAGTFFLIPVLFTKNLPAALANILAECGDTTDAQTFVFKFQAPRKSFELTNPGAAEEILGLIRDADKARAADRLPEARRVPAALIPGPAWLRQLCEDLFGYIDEEALRKTREGFMRTVWF